MALLPGLENPGDFLKRTNEKGEDDEGENLTFTRAKCFEICFGLVDEPGPLPDLSSAIFGGEILQGEKKKGLNEFGDRFCRHVRRELAALPPFELRLVSNEKWTSSRETKRIIKAIENNAGSGCDRALHSHALFPSSHGVQKAPGMALCIGLSRIQ